jgi:putative ABC transport system substrate-binding protein
MTGNSKKAGVFGVALFAILFALCSVGALLLALCVSVEAQQAAKVSRIVYLSGAPIGPDRMDAFRLGLSELGYVEDKNIVIEWRSAEGKMGRIPALAAEIVRLKADIIISAGGAVTQSLKKATSTIPIVMANSDDPVATGFVASLSRPGGNITGLSTFSPETSGKRVELLKDVLPKLSRVAAFRTSGASGDALALSETRRAAEALGIQLQFIDVQSSKDFETAFQAAAKGRAEAVLWLVSGVVGGGNQPQVVQLAIRSRLPVIYERPNFVTRGGLMSYGVDLNDLARRAAIYVDKILKGATPADLPVEQPTKFEFIINLKAAKQIGLTIPPNVLARADKVIK